MCSLVSNSRKPFSPQSSPQSKLRTSAHSQSIHHPAQRIIKCHYIMTSLGRSSQKRARRPFVGTMSKDLVQFMSGENTRILKKL